MDAVTFFMSTNPSNADPRLTLGSTPSPASNPEAATDPERREVLQALLAFSTLHEQIRRRRSEQGHPYGGGEGSKWDDAWDFEQFVLDEVLELVAERARVITGADGVAIALAEGEVIVCRASVGPMTPDRGIRLDPNSGFSGACFRTGKVIRCDDAEADPRVNVEVCRRLGTRSMVAVPLLGQENVVGLLEAFSTAPYGFSDADVHSLKLLAELTLSALRPEEEDRIVQAAKAATTGSGVADLERLWQLSREVALPALPPPVPPQREELPLEFSAGSFAPDLYLAPTSSRYSLLLIALVAVGATVLAGSLWWKTQTRARRADTRPVARTATQAEAPVATPAPSAPAPEPTAALPSGASVGTEGSATGDSSGETAANTTPVQVTAVRHWSAAGSTTVSIDLEGAVQYEAHRLNAPERIYVDLPDTFLAPGVSVKPMDVKDGLVDRIRVAQSQPGMTRVVLEIKQGATYSVSLEHNPYRLVIEVTSPGAVAPKSEMQAPAPADKATVTALLAAPPSREDLELRPHVPKLRIVLDAGHGGWDLGTVGRQGLLEKDLVLEVAQRLGNLLEKRLAAEVVFTRRNDSYVPLEQRAEMANRAQADLFVSVHANYSELESARGVETYYSNFFVAPEARESEAAGDASADSTSHAHLTGVELKDKVDGSRKLAASVQRALYGSLVQQSPGIRNRGVKEASFVVLTGTQMPSILAEISFVSSPTDEERLQSAEYREKIAEALYVGIERFAAASNRMKVASASGRPGGR